MLSQLIMKRLKIIGTYLLIVFSLVGCNIFVDYNSESPISGETAHELSSQNQYDIYILSENNDARSNNFLFDEMYKIYNFDGDIYEFIELHMEIIGQSHDINFYYNLGFNGIPGESISGLPPELLKQLYNDLNKYFGFINISPHPIIYAGYYTGDERFVHSNFVPFIGMDATSILNYEYGILSERNEYRGDGLYITPINSIKISRSLYDYLTDYVYIGRNFTSDDFYINSPSDMVNVLLGYNYIGVYEIGDIITLELYFTDFEFRVIGFLDEGVKLPNLNRPFHHTLFDNSIVIPFFDIDFEPYNEENRRFQAIYYSQKLSGAIRIEHDNNAISLDNEKILEQYLDRVNQIAGAYGMEFDIPLLPVPGLWFNMILKPYRHSSQINYAASIEYIVSS